jgi:DNA-binding transcriptional regulator YiaG
MMTPKERLASTLDIIEHLMDDVGLTETDIARELNVNVKTVSRWWTKRSHPTRNHFIALLGLQSPEEKEI